MTGLPLPQQAASSGYALEWIGPTDRRRETALALALSGEPEVSTQVRWQMDALTDAVGRQGLVLDVLVAACMDGQPVAASLAIESPGRSAVMHTAWPHTRRELRGAACDALGLAARAVQARGVRLLQTILDAEDTRLHEMYRDVGFTYLTELLYMDGPAAHAEVPSPAIPGVRLATYSVDRQRAFLAALENTYIDSMDCPGLTGIRKTEDVLAGHRATGKFDPQGWYVALCGDTPIGVLLTAEVVQRRALEIVYIGVSAAMRGQGVGKYLMHTAHRRAQELALPVVTLAVDAINAPARRLYESSGYRATHRRRVWIMHADTGETGA